MQPRLPDAPSPAAAAASADNLVDALFEAGELEHTRPRRARTITIVLLGLALWFAPVGALAALFGSHSVFVDQGLFFSQTAVVTFGGAYSVLSYVAQRAVEDFGWLRPGEMVDGLALAETTPGPLILVLQFVAYLGAYRAPLDFMPLHAGLLGSAVALWTTFVPCFIWIFAGAPYVESLRKSGLLSAALASITAAVVGVILNLSVWFAMHTWFARVRAIDWGPLHTSVPDLATVDAAAVALTALAMIATFRFRWGMPATLAGCALLGLAWRLS